MTLQVRTSVYFAIGFLVLWTVVSIILFSNFRRVLIASFDEQLQARALMVAQNTNVSPRIVPLPQGAENFTIIYFRDKNADTLFAAANTSFAYPSGTDSILSNNGWRVIRVQQSLENGGQLHIIFGLPSEGIDKRIDRMELLISLVLPLGFILALVVAYWLSGNLLKPVKQVINLANAININNDVELLKEPEGTNELKELVVSFNRMLLRIKEQSNRQAAFFASASHELRTPLSVMQTRLQVLKMATDNAETESVYTEQLNEVQRLTKMVNDFLLLSELKNGVLTVSKNECSLSEVITDTIARFKHKWIERKLQFKISYAPVEASYEVFEDESKLKIIFDNLIENSIKYSPEQSGIDVLVEKTDQNFVIRLVNKIRYDINPMISDVKNEFYHSKPLHGEGFGLGLWIASQLALLQDIELYFTIKEKELFEACIVI